MMRGGGNVENCQTLNLKKTRMDIRLNVTVLPFPRGGEKQNL